MVLAWIAGTVLRIRRAHVIASMTRAGVAQPARAADAMYRSLGRGLVELLALAVGRRARADIDTSVLDALRARGRGVVIATAHTGNWDLVACALAERVPLTVVTKRLSVGLIDRVWQGLRAARGIALVGVGGAARATAGALGRNEAVAMLVDQAPDRDRAVIAVAFLGATAWVDLAPALVAMRARAPLLVAFAERRADGSHAAHVAGVIDPPARASRAWAESAMRQATAWLEESVRAHPEQWLWMHRRWKAVPDVRVARVAGSPFVAARR